MRPPALDFGWIDFADEHHVIPRDRLIRHYVAATGAEPEALEATSRLVLIRILASHAEWLARTDGTDTLTGTLPRLQTVLNNWATASRARAPWKGP